MTEPLLKPDHIATSSASAPRSGPTGPLPLSGKSPKIQAGHDPAELAHASAVLAAAGIRIMQLDGATTIGVWSDLDSPELREAIAVMGSAGLPVHYLDGAGIPDRYKLRRVAGEPVPMSVLAEMERHPANPWEVRDQMLSEMGGRAKPIVWAESKAATINRVFQEQGVGARPGRITHATVRHGEGYGG